jgi:hypothetical protein
LNYFGWLDFNQSNFIWKKNSRVKSDFWAMFFDQSGSDKIPINLWWKNYLQKICYNMVSLEFSEYWPFLKMFQTAATLHDLSHLYRWNFFWPFSFKIIDLYYSSAIILESLLKRFSNIDFFLSLGYHESKHFQTSGGNPQISMLWHLCFKLKLSLRLISINK